MEESSAFTWVERSSRRDYKGSSWLEVELMVGLVIEVLRGSGLGSDCCSGCEFLLVVDSFEEGS